MTAPVQFHNPAALVIASASTGTAIARACRMEVSEHFEHSEACLIEANRIINAPAPQFPGLPEDPAKLEAVIRKAATAQGVHAAMVDAARDAAQYAGASMGVAYRASLPGYIEALRAQFTDTARQFADARAIASDRLGPFDDDDAVTAHVTLQRTAATLDVIAHNRTKFGETVAEPGLHSTLPWHMIAPPAADESDRIQYLRDLLAEMRTRDWLARDAVSRWTSPRSARYNSAATPGSVSTPASAVCRT
jgi:hypothetical protein